MIEVKNVKKEYRMADETVVALNGIDVTFREREFVSVVGPSGCGKTTLLNVIGGLDRYTSGDILINGKSTEQYRDTDWDTYRNSTVGFVFQNYNLIPHLNVIENVMMALSLSGIGYKERYEKAKAVLKEVGLESKLKKRPNQLSGGQMQRVAIARALVNDPEILLADEPTGALDSKTSVQIMELIKKISGDRLVIMVTHNEDLAKEYSNRIVEMLDGVITSDSNPVKVGEETEEEQVAQKQTEEKKKTRTTRMSFLEALKSSFKNLFSKKGRTIAVSVAGSIGIIGIGLVLSLSSGMQNTVGGLQSDALAGFPITISDSVTTTTFEIGRQTEEKKKTDDEGNPIFYYYDSKEETVRHENILSDTFVNYLNAMDKKYYNSISYSKGIALNFLYKTDKNVYGKVSASSSSSALSFLFSSSLSEIPDSKEFILSQYDILAGKYPDEYNELVLVVPENNKISAGLLTELGFEVKNEYAPSDFIGKTFKVVGNDDYYYLEDGIYKEKTDYKEMYEANGENMFEAKIVGIMRVKESASSEFLSTGVGYSFRLTEKMLLNASSSAVVAAQKANATVNVRTGEEFASEGKYKDALIALGGSAVPTGVQIYPKTFEMKDKIKAYLDDYNKGKAEEDRIVYSDLAETISSTISSLVDIITIVLSVIAAISLIVSSIMISIIIYVSVIERTKEIGIMRSIGARKRDISRIFSAEAITIGLIAGLIGVVVTYIVDLPLSLIITKLMESTFTAVLPVWYAVMLVAISIALTFIAGLLPSIHASRKDPVAALRTE